MSNSVAGKFSERAATHPHAGSLYAPDGSRKYLNRAERRRVLAVIAKLELERALFASMLAWTGARVSEVLALTPLSFQVEDGIVAVTTLKRRCFSVREVPIPTPLMAAIDAGFCLQSAQLDPLLARCRLWPWHRVTAWRYIKAIMRDAQIVGRPACPRGLRHGFGVGTLQAAVPLNLVQRWMGHARMTTTAIYTNACGPEERAIAARFWIQFHD